MKLLFKKIEMVTLILHMTIMRKNVKKGFKSNYGKQEGKEVLKGYDELKERLVEEAEGTEDESLEKPIDFSTQNIDMLSSFLNWYLLEIELTLEGSDLNKEDNQQIEVMTRIKEKLDGAKNLE